MERAGMSDMAGLSREVAVSERASSEYKVEGIRLRSDYGAITLPASTSIM
jgi:hypothetical protein